MEYKENGIPYVIDGLEYDITNLLVTVNTSDINNNFIRNYILSGESAQEVSFKLYGSSYYYWTLYLLNNVVNPFEDWYMSPSQLREYVYYKYSNPDSPHDYYYIGSHEPLNNKLTNDMQYLYDNKLPLPHDISFNSNFDYEAKLNDTKKTIRAIKPDMILEFINIYHERLQEL